MLPNVRIGDRVYSQEEPGAWWNYGSLDWWRGASTGLDIDGCRVTATIDGDALLVQHGENPEAVRRFTLDELNNVGAVAWHDVVGRWCDEIHTMGCAR